MLCLWIPARGQRGHYGARLVVWAYRAVQSYWLRWQRNREGITAFDVRFAGRFDDYAPAAKLSRFD